MYLCTSIQLIPPFPYQAWVSPTKCGLKRGLPSLHMASPGVITYAVTQVWVDPPKIHMEPQKSPLPEGKSSSKNGFFWVLALCFQVLIPSDEPPWTMAGISAYSAWYIFKREKMFGPAMSSSECRVFCSSQTLQAKGLFIPTVGWFGFGGLKCRLKSWQFLPNDWLGIPVFCSKSLIS